MKAVIILCFCAVVALANGVPANTRIVGGWEALPRQLPYIVSLRIESENFHFCGATIISKRTLLTAAHCRYVREPLMVAVVGTTTIDDKFATRVHVEEFIIHPDYNPYEFTNDIAVVILAEDIDFNEKVQPIKVSTSPVPDNEKVTSAGWGYTTYNGEISNDLHWMSQTVVNAEECAEASPGETITGKICALDTDGNGQSVCFGDTGGPLVDSNDELVGVVTMNVHCNPNKPDFFTNIYLAKSWIEANTR